MSKEIKKERKRGGVGREGKRDGGREEEETEEEEKRKQKRGKKEKKKAYTTRTGIQRKVDDKGQR